MRAIFFTASGSTHVDAKAMAEFLEGYLGDGYRVTTAWDDRNNHRDIPWEDWASGIPGRRNPLTRKPTYDLIIVEEGRIGKITYGLLMAMRSPKLRSRVRVFTGEKLLPPKKIRIVDPESWKDGWEVSA